jgi:23S rRNA pseudouridine1911/1915/1917 synthase
VSAARRIDLVVSPEDAGERLDVFLGRHPEVGSRAAAQRLIDAGAVTVDGAVRQKRHKLAGGEHVVATIAEPELVDPGAAGEGVPHEVVYEDDAVIVVDKPPGVVVHPSAGHPAGTLAQALAGRAAGGPDPWRPGIVHRLDRDTSGLLVVAKTDAALRHLQEQIRTRAMRREYLALVDGRPDARTGTIDAPIGRDRGDRTAHSIATDKPRDARTHFEVERAHPRTTLLRVTLETGRTHQIRVHLAAIGHPVCGDAQYGGALCGRRIGLTRQFLHATKLTFVHPSDGHHLVCESNLPDDLLHASEAAAREPASDGPDGSRT